MEVKEYAEMIQSYLDGDLAADEFARRYDRDFLSEPGGMPKPLFDILEDLWEDVEAYSPTWTPEDEKQSPFGITEKTLRAEAADALAKLRQYSKERSS